MILRSGCFSKSAVVFISLPLVFLFLLEIVNARQSYSGSSLTVKKFTTKEPEHHLTTLAKTPTNSGSTLVPLLERYLDDEESSRHSTIVVIQTKDSNEDHSEASYSDTFIYTKDFSTASTASENDESSGEAETTIYLKDQYKITTSNFDGDFEDEQAKLIDEDDFKKIKTKETSLMGGDLLRGINNIKSFYAETSTSFMHTSTKQSSFLRSKFLIDNDNFSDLSNTDSEQKTRTTFGYFSASTTTELSSMNASSTTQFPGLVRMLNSEEKNSKLPDSTTIGPALTSTVNTGTEKFYQVSTVVNITNKLGITSRKPDSGFDSFTRSPYKHSNITCNLLSFLLKS
jgi:hypothetical protein